MTNQIWVLEKWLIRTWKAISIGGREMGRETIVIILKGPKLGWCGMEKSDWCLLEIGRTGGGEGLSTMFRIEP